MIVKVKHLKKDVWIMATIGEYQALLKIGFKHAQKEDVPADWQTELQRRVMATDVAIMEAFHFSTQESSLLADDVEIPSSALEDFTDLKRFVEKAMNSAKR